jgi:hypothetical protein
MLSSLLARWSEVAAALGHLFSKDWKASSDWVLGMTRLSANWIYCFMDELKLFDSSAPFHDTVAMKSKVSSRFSSLKRLGHEV